MRVFTILVVSLLSSAFITGCWDRKEINDVAFVLATGIDKESNKYRVTLQIALPGQMGAIGSSGGSGGTGGKKSWVLSSVVGNSIREANELQQLSLSRLLYFSHRRVVLIGQNMAKSGIDQITDLITSVPQNRMSSYVLVARDLASNVLNTQTQLEKFPAEKIRKITEILFETPPTFKQVADILESQGIDVALPAVSVVANNQGSMKNAEVIAITGLAVFKHNKLSGFVESNQAKGVLLAMNQANNPTITVRIPNTKGSITIQLRGHHCELKPVIQNNKVSMMVNFKSKAYVLANASNVDMTSGGFTLDLEKVASQRAKQYIEDGILSLQKKFHSDPIGFGDTIFRNDPKLWSRLEPNWKQIYPNVSVVVNTTIHIEQTGTITKPLGTKEVELIK